MNGHMTMLGKIYRNIVFVERINFISNLIKYDAMQKSTKTLRIRRLSDQLDHQDYLLTSPAERLAAMWQLAVDTWTFQGERIAEPRLPRHIVNIQRSKR